MAAGRYSFAWPARLSADDDGRVLVTFPDFDGAATDGADRAEALAEAADCLEEAIAIRLAEGEDIPQPGPRRAGMVVVAPSPLFAAKAALAIAMREAGIGKSALARQLGCDEKDVRRLLDPRHGSRIGRIDEALRALNYQLRIEIGAA